MDLVFIPKSKIKSVWPLVRSLMRDGFRQPNRRMSIPAIKQTVMAGQWQMWIIWEEEKKIPKAVFFTELYEEISGLKIGAMRFFSGRDRRDWLDLLESLEEHMRHAGVQRMEIWARRGWLKELPEYKMTHVLLEKDLDNGIGQVDNDERKHDRSVRASDTGPGVDTVASAGA